MSKIETLALRAPLARRSAATTPLLGLRAGLRRWLLRSREHESVRRLNQRERRDVGLDSDAWGANRRSRSGAAEQAREPTLAPPNSYCPGRPVAPSSPAP